jgi:Toprim domain
MMGPNIHTQIGGQAEHVLNVLGIDPVALRRHIHCPLPTHDDHRPSFRVDRRSNRYYCSCTPRGGSLIDLVIAMGVATDFKSSARFLREQLPMIGGGSVDNYKPLTVPKPIPKPSVSPHPQTITALPEHDSDLHPSLDANAFDEYLKRCVPVQQHPYVRAKRIAPVGAMVDQRMGHLVLPLRDVDGVTRGVQMISGNGDKWFADGTHLRGHGLLLGSIADKRGLGVCEGWATGVTLYSLLNLPILVAFTASNLMPAARPYHDLGIPLIIFGDRDANGTGQRYAQEAATALKAKLQFPPDGKGDSDFNDFYTRLIFGAKKMGGHHA